MVSHMSAVQVALLFNSYLVHFYSQRNCSLISCPFNQENEDLFLLGQQPGGKRSGLVSSDLNAPEVRSIGLDPRLGQCDFERDTLLSQCLTRSRSINGYRRNCQENLTKCRGGMGAGVGWGQGFTGNGLTFYSDEKAILRLCESPLSS